MDRKLKERLVGAALLVLAAALVIPLFLDGPAPEAPADRPTVALPPAAESDARTRTVRLEQSRDTPTAPLDAVPEAPADELPSPAPAAQAVEPTPAAQTQAAPGAPPPAATQPAPTTPPPVEQPRPASPPVAAAPAPRSEPAPSAAPGSGNWVIQLGSFGSRDNAERLAAELREKRYQSFVTRLESDGRTLHRVRVGPAGSREEADRLLQRLRADGYSGQAVPE